MENKLLVVVDMQNDFIDCAFENECAKSIVDNVCNRIRNWDGYIVYTMDTHGDDYMSTSEGSYIPYPHCVNGTYGWELNDRVKSALNDMKHLNPIMLKKSTFGSQEVASIIKSLKINSILLIGLCTDICVISNAIIAQSAGKNVFVSVDASCCAGATTITHDNALSVMKNLGIEIVGKD